MAAESYPTLQDVLSRNLRVTREARRLTVRALSQRLTDVGAPMLPSGITKIELGTHRVDVKQLVAFAAVLNSSPAFLLTPGDGEPVQVTPTQVVDGAQVADWLKGERPLTGTVEDFLAVGPRVLWVRHLIDQHPAVAALTELTEMARSVIHDSYEGSMDPSIHDRIALLRSALDRASAYVNLLADEKERMS